MADDRRSGSDGQADNDLLVQVCLQCGLEYMFEEDPAPDDLTCEKCGSKVFRSFYAESGHEAAEDFRQVTERDTLTTDPASDVTRGDLHDLNNL